MPGASGATTQAEHLGGHMPGQEPALCSRAGAGPRPSLQPGANDATHAPSSQHAGGKHRVQQHALEQQQQHDQPTLPQQIEQQQQQQQQQQQPVPPHSSYGWFLPPVRKAKWGVPEHAAQAGNGQ